MSHTFLVLIPKKEFPSTFDDYQLISCLGVSYKVILKMLDNRIASILPNLTTENQMTFIKGRMISDCIILAQDFMHQPFPKIHAKIQLHEYVTKACITIDFRKAFDTLHRDTIDSMMEMFGFDNIFRELVMVCVKSASFSTWLRDCLQRSSRMGEECAKVAPCHHFTSL